jgi:hypothetical protein
MTKLTGYDTQSLAIIDNSSILEKSDFDKILALKDELNHTFLHSQMFRTRTEMEVSVLNDIHFPTPDAKYWQSMREQNVHYNELVSLSYEYRKNIIEIKKLERQLESEEDDLEAELLRIEIDRKKFGKLQQERVAKDRIREIQQWHEIKKNLLPELSHGIDDVNEHQLLSYAREFIKETMLMPPSTPAADKRNIVGKMITTLRVVKEKGYKIEGLTDDEIKFLEANGVKDLWQ